MQEGEALPPEHEGVPTEWGRSMAPDGVIYLTMLSINQTMRCQITERKIMNWKGHARKRTWPNLRYSLAICLKGIRKSTMTVRITFLLADIRTLYLLNKTQEN